MTGFLIGAALLALAALVFIVWPLLQSAAPARRVLPIVAALIAVALASGLYYRLSNWSWSAPPPDEQQVAVATLVRATSRNPEDLDAWLQLGNAYVRLEQFPLARRAFERANRLADGKSDAALSGLAETVLLSGDTANSARAAEMLERALQINPRSGKALFYTALSAIQAGNLSLARERFSQMLKLDAPAAVHAALERQIATLDEQMAAAGAAPAAADAAASRGTEVKVEIHLAPALNGKVPVGASLFVFVRNPAGGAPLAVKRLTTTFPQKVALSAADTMIAGNSIQPGQTVNVVARISATGSPTAQPGDLSGELSYVAGKDPERQLTINH